MNASTQALKHYATSLIFTAVTVVTGLVVTPRVLEALGDDRFAGFRGLADWASQLTLLDFGLGAALGSNLARALGRNDGAAVRAALKAGRKLYRRVAWAAALLAASATPLMLYLVPVAKPSRLDLIAGWLILGVGGTFGWLAAPWRCHLEASQRGNRVNLYLTVQAILIALFSVALARAGFGISGQAAAILIGTSLFALTVTLDARQRVPSGQDMAPPPDLVRDAGPALTLSLAGRLGPLTDGLLVVGLLGTIPGTRLFVTTRLITMAQAQLLVVGNATWAALAQAHGRGDIEAFRMKLLALTRLVSTLGVAAAAPLIGFDHAFVARWVGGGRFGGDLLVAVATFNAVSLAMIALWSWCFTGTGHAHAIVRSSLATALTGVGLGALLALAPGVGLVGPPLGSALAVWTIQAWALPLSLRDVFGVAPRQLAAAALGPWTWGLPYVVGVAILGRSWDAPARSWFLLVPTMAAVTLPPLFLAWKRRRALG